MVMILYKYIRTKEALKFGTNMYNKYMNLIEFNNSNVA